MPVEDRYRVDCSRLPFVIESAGRFTPSRVNVTVEDKPRPTTPELESLIAETWETETGPGSDPDRLLFNGPLFRLLSHQVTAGETPTYHLVVSPTCFRDFLGTNLLNHHRISDFGLERFANPVGTTATLTAADGLICYGRRSDQVAYHAGYVHTFGGGLEDRDRTADGRVDPFGSVMRELREELNLADEEVEDFVCVGLIRDKEIHQPELLFEGRLRLTAKELIARWHTAEAKQEHQDIVTLPDLPEAIAPFVRDCPPIAPVASGALFLHGLLAWGPEWFARESARSF